MKEKGKFDYLNTKMLMKLINKLGSKLFSEQFLLTDFYFFITYVPYSLFRAEKLNKILDSVTNRIARLLATFCK